jgi:hypothetical protein
VLRESAQESLALAEFLHTQLVEIAVQELIEDCIRNALLLEFWGEVLEVFGFQYGFEFFFHTTRMNGR